MNRPDPQAPEWQREQLQHGALGQHGRTRSRYPRKIPWRRLVWTWLVFWLLLFALGAQEYLWSGGRQLRRPFIDYGSSELVATALAVLQIRRSPRFDHLLGQPGRILNTPSAHRVHHASNFEYLDGNYGGVLIVFDRLFGTYIAERPDVPCRYGLVRPMTSCNLLVVDAPFYKSDPCSKPSTTLAALLPSSTAA